MFTNKYILNTNFVHPIWNIISFVSFNSTTFYYDHEFAKCQLKLIINFVLKQIKKLEKLAKLRNLMDKFINKTKGINLGVIGH